MYPMIKRIGYFYRNILFSEKIEIWGAEMEISNMLDFIYKSPIADFAVDNVKKILLENGFTELVEHEFWNIQPYTKYFVIKHGTSIIAFITGEQEIKNYGFNLIGAHTDAPCFKIKPNMDITDSGNYVKLNTEMYGGAIMNTWFDRPLSVAGKIYLKTSNPLKPKVESIYSETPLLVIPNLAIHMNREINKGLEYNAQKHTLPILGIINEQLEEGDYLLNLIANYKGINKEDIIDFELFLHGVDKGCVLGLNQDMVMSPRLDDLSMVYCGLEALLNAEPSQSTQVLACFDHEEIGSTTAEGANSNLLLSTLERILIGTGDKEKESLFIALSHSLMISADLAHAHHPNYADKTDITSKPLMGRGPVIKYNANKKYATNAYISSVIKNICLKNEIPVQSYVNRSDMPGGSTIGPAIASKLNIPIADMGIAVFGMHSIMETGSIKDLENITKIFQKFYELRGI